MSIDRSDETTVRGPRVWLVAMIALVSLAAGALAIVAIGNLRGDPPVVVPLRLSLALPPELTPGGGPDYPFGLSLAPDGRRLVFPAAKSGLTQLWLRELSTGDTQPLPGTDDGVLPFWAPDGRAIAFFAAGHLRVFTLEDAGVRDLAPAPSPRGGVWHPGGDIIFAPEDEDGLVRRKGSDGTVEPYTTLDRAAGESAHRHPALLAGGRAIVFFVRSNEPTRQGIWIAPLDQPTVRKRVINADAGGAVAGNAVLYSSDGALVAQPIDVEARTAIGRPVLLGTMVGRSPHHQLFATTGGDVLLFGAPATGLREIRWADRLGALSGTLGEAMDAWDVRISPTGVSVAVAAVDLQLKTLDIFTYEGDRPLPRRISPAIDADDSPVWSRDGTRLAWVTGRRAVTMRSALADKPDETVRTFDHPIRVTDWSPDAQWIVVSETQPDTHDDLWLVSPANPSEPRAYAQSPFNERQGVVSPDGKWLAYASDESGRFEIYVDSFPAPGNRARLTGGGGSDPRWKRDGGEIYFRRGMEIHAVIPTFSGATPIAASSARLFDARGEIRAYDVTSDGLRFLLNLPATETERQPITIIVNWQSLIR